MGKGIGNNNFNHKITRLDELIDEDLLDGYLSGVRAIVFEFESFQEECLSHRIGMSLDLT